MKIKFFNFSASTLKLTSTQGESQFRFIIVTKLEYTINKMKNILAVGTRFICL